jgi:hypothetical protein
VFAGRIPIQIQYAEYPLSKELNKIFAPTCLKIQRLVENQLNQLSAISDRTKCKAVLLAGGFGESVYLFEFLEAKLKGVKLLRVDK